MWSHRNSHSLLVGMQNGTATLENSFSTVHKIQHPLAINPAIMVFGIYQKDLSWKRMSTQTLHMDVISSLMPKCQNWKEARVSFKWANEWSVIHPDNGLLLSTNNNKWAITSHEKSWRKHRYILQSEKSQSQQVHIVDSYHRYFGKAKTRDTVKWPVVARG